jgi:hypothetical protein
VVVTNPPDTETMASSRATSAALLISVYVDAERGGDWFARLQGFDDPLTPQLRSERVATEEEVLLAVRTWLKEVLRVS